MTKRLFNKYFQKRILLIIFWVLIVNPTAKSSEVIGISQLDQRFLPLQHLLAADPYTLITKLDQQYIERLDSSLLRAQAHLLLSLSFDSLERPDDSANQARLAQELVDPKNEPWLYHHIALSLALASDRQGEPKKGLTAINSAIHWAEENRDRSLLINALEARATIQTSLVQYLQAQKDLEHAYQLASDKKDYTKFELQVTKGELQEAFALIYEYRQEAALSIPYFRASVDYHRAEKNWVALGAALYGLGRAHKYNGEVEIGVKLLTESEKTAEKFHDTQGQAYALKELASIKEHRGFVQQAKEMNLTAMEIFKKANNIYMLNDVSHSLFRIALQQKKYVEAQRYIEIAENLVNEKNMPYQWIKLKENKAKLLAATNHYKEAYESSLVTQQKRRKLLVKQSSRELHALRVRYQLENKEQQNELLQKENLLNRARIESIKQKNSILTLVIVFSVIFTFLVFFLYLKNKAHKKILEKLADIDDLTGLYNRRKGMEIVSQQFDLAKRHQQEFCLALLDIDWFKKINDSFGHPVGDLVLNEFAKCCKESLRHTDIIARIGGEEFLIALPHTDKAATIQLIEKLRETVNLMSHQIGATPEQKKKLQITFSAGVIEQNQANNILDLVQKVDSAMYQAKKNGRNKTVCY